MKLKNLMICILSSLILTACKFEGVTEVHGNGSGTLRSAVGFTAQERQDLEKRSNGNKDFCNTSQAPLGVTITEELRGDKTWCVTEVPFDNLKELSSLYEQKKGIRVNHLEISDGNFYYDIEIDTLSETSNFSGFAAITWTVILPGTPTNHNATHAEGNKLTWQIQTRSGTVNVQAESEVEKSSPNLPCGSALMISLLLIPLARRDRRM